MLFCIACPVLFKKREFRKDFLMMQLSLATQIDVITHGNDSFRFTSWRRLNFSFITDILN